MFQKRLDFLSLAYYIFPDRGPWPVTESRGAVFLTLNPTSNERRLMIRSPPEQSDNCTPKSSWFHLTKCNCTVEMKGKCGYYHE